MRFENRARAGEELADAVSERHVGEDAVVLALPRGGLPVAAPVARRLDAPLDVMLVRKLGVPRNPELAMGAVASGGVRVLNHGLIRQLGIGEEWLEQEVETQTRELERRGRRYRGDEPPAAVEGRTVILVDDGIATGATVRAAVHAVQAQNPARVIVAVPTAAPDSIRMLEEEVDEVVCPHSPEPFSAVAAWYHDFPQVDDEEVVRILAAARAERPVDPMNEGRTQSGDR